MSARISELAGAEQRAHLFVGNLSPRVTEYMLSEIFAVAGTVQAVQIIPDRDNQHGGLSHAFVEYVDIRAAETALQTLNGHDIFDNKIRVSWAHQGNQNEADNFGHYRVLVEELSPEIKDEDLAKAFSAFGTLSSAQVIRDANTGKSLHYGFLTFQDRTDAEQAIAVMDDEWLGSHAIRVSWANQEALVGPLATHSPRPTHVVQSFYRSRILPRHAGGRPPSSSVQSGSLSYEVVAQQAPASLTTIYVDGLVPYCTPADLIPLFQFIDYSPEIHLQADRGFAYVKLNTHEQACMAIVKLQGQTVHGRTIKCSWGDHADGVAPVPLAAVRPTVAAAPIVSLVPPFSASPLSPANPSPDPEPKHPQFTDPSSAKLFDSLQPKYIRGSRTEDSPSPSPERSSLPPIFDDWRGDDWPDLSELSGRSGSLGFPRLPGTGRPRKPPGKSTVSSVSLAQQRRHPRAGTLHTQIVDKENPKLLSPDMFPATKNIMDSPVVDEVEKSLRSLAAVLAGLDSEDPSKQDPGDSNHIFLPILNGDDESNLMYQVPQVEVKMKSNDDYLGDSPTKSPGGQTPSLLQFINPAEQMSLFRSHPATRFAIFRRAEKWINDAHRQKRLLWLHGPENTGKNLILRGLAEIGYSSGRLAGALVISGEDAHSVLELAFITISRQITTRSPSYQTYADELIKNDPGLPHKPIREHFRQLIEEPFGRSDICDISEAWLIILDGLHYPEDPRQKEILRSIISFVMQYPAARLVWVISSTTSSTQCLDASLHGHFHVSCWEEELTCDSNDAARRVELYLYPELRNIRSTYHLTPSWLPHHRLIQIAGFTCDSYPFAALVIRIIDDPWISDPIFQVEHLISLLNRLDADDYSTTEALDILFIDILTRIPYETYVYVTQVLLSGCLLFDFERHSLISISNVMGFTEDDVYTGLQHLHPLLLIPPPEEAAEQNISFLNNDFPNFLRDPSRSKNYFLGGSTMRLWHQPLLVLNRANAGSSVALDFWRISWPLDDTEQDVLQHKLIFEAAKHIWTALWVGSGHKKPDLTQPVLPFGTLSPPPGLEIMKRIDFSNLIDGYIDESITDVYQFCCRLTSVLSATSRFDHQYSVLMELDTDKVDGKKVSYLYEEYGTPMPPQRFGENEIDAQHSLQALIDRVESKKRLYPANPIMILGKGSKKCVVFKVPDLIDRPYPSSEGLKTWSEVYVLPYS